MLKTLATASLLVLLPVQGAHATTGAAAGGGVSGFFGLTTTEIAGLLMGTLVVLESTKVIDVINDTPDSP